ncbi:MAG: hypothetical protein PVS3B3_39280 [Ktedonobacteraceae bacterium]
MTTLPPTTRRFLVSVQRQPEVYQRVMAHLYEVRALLVHGVPSHSVQQHKQTDWRRLRELGEVLREEATRVRIREAVALFSLLVTMADDALAALAVHESIDGCMAA